MLSVITPSNPGCNPWKLDSSPIITGAGARTGAPCCLSQPRALSTHSHFDTGENDNLDHVCSSARQQEYKFQIHDSRYRECGLDTVIIQSFSHLLKMYSIHVNRTHLNMAGVSGDTDQDVPLIVAGGLQQYLIKNMKKGLETTQQPCKAAGNTHTTFHDLSDSVQLEVLSYLDARDLCVISMVCRHWYCISSDSILWHQRLKRDIRRWDVIGHTTNPQMYRECESDWTNKEIYLRCSPEVNRLVKQSNINFHHLSNILRTFWPKKTPRVAMFGPGLESSTSQIARKILEDKSDIFKATGMFPGQFEGLGSGFTMKMGAVTFHLMTLYSSSKQERESRPRNQRLQHSRLIAHNPHQGAGDVENNQQGAAAAAADSDDENDYEVRKAIKDLCRTLDAFIFVVDASQQAESVRNDRSELRAMINDQWVQADIPVAVLSCTPDGSTDHLPCIDIVEHLRLSRLSRPWQVRECVVDTMAGVSSAIEWVVEQAQRTK